MVADEESRSAEWLGPSRLPVASCSSEALRAELRSKGSTCPTTSKFCPRGWDYCWLGIRLLPPAGLESCPPIIRKLPPHQHNTARLLQHSRPCPGAFLSVVNELSVRPTYVSMTTAWIHLEKECLSSGCFQDIQKNIHSKERVRNVGAASPSKYHQFIGA